jgi:hypothetical protein
MSRRSRTPGPRSLLQLAAALASLGLVTPSSRQAVASDRPPEAGVFSNVPSRLDPAAHYLIYLHGRILESQGRHAVSPDFGPYQYDAILDAFAERGFVVVSEVRHENAGRPFVHKVASQVRRLLAAGVPPGNVTVVGASKGGALTLGIAAELGAPELSFVVLAGCGPYTESLAPRLRGRVLSIFDSVDRFTPSCRATFEKASHLGEHREIVVKLGLDHGLLYRPRAEWVDPACAWARH